MRIIDADKFLAYLIFSKHIDGLTCGEVKEAVEMSKIDVLSEIRAEIEQTADEEQKHDEKWAIGLRYAVKIIDKYAEQEQSIKEIEEVINCDADAETKCKMIYNILTAKPHYFTEQELKVTDKNGNYVYPSDIVMDEPNNVVGCIPTMIYSQIDEITPTVVKAEQEPNIEAYKQVCKERDIAIEQLHELGYELGQKIEPCDDKCHYCEHNFTPYQGNTGEFTEQEQTTKQSCETCIGKSIYVEGMDLCEDCEKYSNFKPKQTEETIGKYAEQEKDAYDKVLDYLKANVDDFPDYHEAIEAVLKMKGGE